MTELITPFIEWLIQCPTIRENKLFFNAVKVENNAIELVTQEATKTAEFVDGSERFLLTFTIFNFKSIAFSQIVKSLIDKNENIDDYLATGDINKWVEEQNKANNYPHFPKPNYEIEFVRPVYYSPTTPTVDNDIMLAKYSIPIQIQVIRYE